MKRAPLDKMAIDLKLTAQVAFTFLYVGARKLHRQITKATLMSMCIECAATGKPAMLYDSSLRSHTFEELVALGDSSIRKALAKFMELADCEFYETTREFLTQDDDGQKPDEALYRPLAFNILKDIRFMEMYNLRDTDIDNIVRIILITNEDLKAFDGDERKSFVFSKFSEPYTCYKEMIEIFSRYRSLQTIAQGYKAIFPLFYSILNALSEKRGYAPIPTDARDKNYQDYFDANYEFFLKFVQDIKDLPLEEYMPAEGFEGLCGQYLDMLAASGRLASMQNCNPSCKACVPNPRKCVSPWIKKHMLEIYRAVFFCDAIGIIADGQPSALDPDPGLQTKTFEQYCHEQYKKDAGGDAK
jgi:hypothetical protein